MTLTTADATAPPPTMAWRTLTSVVVAAALLLTVVSLLDYSVA
ncbi:hypothetical protein OK015_06740 [Mycobacterium sp. Aquia_216]|nr:hypothetical protein [Mycobacterium sp. Aquia_216]WAJ46176.1 hypothetical protein OK015_06740 [Mycobacterium sp. Aquia_216]